jgi:HEAT repeat protein
MNVVCALGMINDKRVIEILLPALKDEDNDVRAGAAEALGFIRDKRAVEPLKKALKDEDPEVRKAASWALELVEEKRARATHTGTKG